MSADKYPCIFSRQMATIVYIFNARAGGIIPQRWEHNFVLERSNTVRTCKIRHSGSGCIAYEFYEG